MNLFDAATKTPSPLLRRARRELGPILAFLAVAVLAMAFWHLAGEMTEGDTRTFDVRILYGLRDPANPAHPLGPAWLELAAADMTALGSVTVLGTIVVLVSGLFLVLGRPSQAFMLAAAALSGVTMSNLLKGAFQRERPPVSLHLAPAINASFPSGHAMLSAIVYLSLGALIGHYAQSRRIRTYALCAAGLLTLLVGASRVYLGVHWPTDVIGGWCVGAGWAVAWWTAAVMWERRGGRSRSVAD